MKTDRARSTDRPGNGQTPDRGDTSSGPVPSELDQLIERAGARFAVDLESLTRDLPRSTKPVAPPEEPHVPRSPDPAARRDVATALRPYDLRAPAESRRRAGDEGPATPAPPPSGPVKPIEARVTSGPNRPGGRAIWWLGAGVAAALILAGGLIASRFAGQGQAPAEVRFEPARPTATAATGGSPVAPAVSVGAAAAGASAQAGPATVGALTSAVPAAAAPSAAAPTSPALAVAPTLPAAVTWRSLLDQGFASLPPGWPNNPSGTAWAAGGTYRLHVNQPPRFVAIDAPLNGPIADARVRASFRKIGGPPGGGYGLIVRGQNPGSRDGVNQGGRYYVLEVGDRGEVGAWRREEDRWVDLLPWTPSTAVRPGMATNELVVEARGPRLSLRVNGVEAITVTDETLASGAVGVFAGGDLNEVALEHFAVETTG